MKTAGLITEYNPFTRGHALHLEEARLKTGADFCIAAMSGDFVQRGEPALFSKHLRTEMALRSGVDAVFELPVDTASGSAEFFAAGAVFLLTALGADYLVFGSESGEIAPFLELSELLLEEPPLYREALKCGLQKGLSFPAARMQALILLGKRELSFDPSVFLSTPNNILGVEYCKALRRIKSPLLPVTIKREGAGYHDSGLDSSRLSSASALRKLLLNRQYQEVLPSQVSPCTLPVYEKAMKDGGPLTSKDFSLLLFARLLEKDTEDLTRILDLSPELAARIRRLQNQFLDWPSFVSLLKTRELTQTRIQRALLHLLLNIEEWKEPSFARLLGFQKSSAPLLGYLKKKSTLPILTKLADASSVLSDDAAKELALTTHASQLYQAVFSQVYGKPFLHEYQKQVVIL